MTLCVFIQFNGCLVHVLHITYLHNPSYFVRGYHCSINLLHLFLFWAICIVSLHAFSFSARIFVMFLFLDYLSVSLFYSGFLRSVCSFESFIQIITVAFLGYFASTVLSPNGFWFLCFDLFHSSYFLGSSDVFHLCLPLSCSVKITFSQQYVWAGI